MAKSRYLTREQLKSELDRCLTCPTKPCLEACPVNCSPMKFIEAARGMEPQDLGRAAAIILTANPVGESCALTCPRKFCMEACSRNRFDTPINIPAVQASILRMAREAGTIPATDKTACHDVKVSVLGAGPGGLAAAAVLAAAGCEVSLHDPANKPGGAMRAGVSDSILPDAAIAADTDFVASLGRVAIHYGVEMPMSGELPTAGVAAVIDTRPEAEEGDHIHLVRDYIASQVTAVEAVEHGKQVAMDVLAELGLPMVESPMVIPSLCKLPVSLETNLFGHKLRSPFLLSAAQATDGLTQVEAAYEAGWPGVIMKTSFDGMPIHVPGRYMVKLGEGTYGNADNVSAHALDRVCRELEILHKRWPERLSFASTGGPISGDEEYDCAGWRHNTKKLEAAGAPLVEYSLSCPQGGDGMEGRIASQSTELTEKIIHWVLSGCDPDIPKIFKLSGAVASIKPILAAVKRAMDRNPKAKAGVTLANSFPSMTMRDGLGGDWAKGIVVGMAGAGVLPISYLILAEASDMGVPVLANGGAMNYRDAANMLALGARVVQFCSLPMKRGVRCIEDLEEGLSHLLKAEGLSSIEELIGRALPEPIADFMDLSPEKGVAICDPEKCVQCGVCTNCNYQALKFNAEGYPVVDPNRCIGCGFCVDACFTGAMSLRPRQANEPAEPEQP